MPWRGVSVVSRERGGDVGIVHVLLRIIVAPFVVVVGFRFRQSLSPARRDLAFPFLVLSFLRIHLRSRVVLLRNVFSFLMPLSFFICRVRCA